MRSLLPQLESTPMLLAKRQVGNYVIGLGTLGYLYTTLSYVLEVLIEADKMADDLKLRDYTLVIGPEASYITTTPLPEVLPPLPQPREVPPVPREEVAINTFGCREAPRGMSANTRSTSPLLTASISPENLMSRISSWTPSALAILLAISTSIPTICPPSTYS